MQQHFIVIWTKNFVLPWVIECSVRSSLQFIYKTVNISQASPLRICENYFHKLQLILQYRLSMLSNSWKKYDYFIAGLIFTPEVFLQCKKVWGPSWKGGDREIWYTSSKFYSDITYYFWLSIFSNRRATLYNPYIKELIPLEFLVQIRRHWKGWDAFDL